MKNKHQHHIRVIAGEYKARRLCYPEERILRPTMGRTRESLFSSIQDVIPGQGFVDLFCAAGGVGIEALSRGASFVHFVERHPLALEYLRRNLAACEVDSGRFSVSASDVYRSLDDGLLEDENARIVFADPPYEGDYVPRLLAHFGQRAYDHVVLLVVEHRGPLEAVSTGGLAFDRTKKFGDTFLSFWKR